MYIIHTKAGQELRIQNYLEKSGLLKPSESLWVPMKPHLFRVSSASGSLGTTVATSPGTSAASEASTSSTAGMPGSTDKVANPINDTPAEPSKPTNDIPGDVANQKRWITKQDILLPGYILLSCDDSWDFVERCRNTHFSGFGLIGRTAADPASTTSVAKGRAGKDGLASDSVADIATAKDGKDGTGIAVPSSSAIAGGIATVSTPTGVSDVSGTAAKDRSREVDKLGTDTRDTYRPGEASLYRGREDGADTFLQVTEEELSLIRSLCGEVSKGVKNASPGSKVRIISGPLVDLQGYIVKVEPHHKSARVRLPLFGREIDIWVSCDVVYEM